MRTVIETPTFQKQAEAIWRETERWAASGHGKRGGARVIFFNLSEQGVVYLVAVYSKVERTNMVPHEIKKAV